MIKKYCKFINEFFAVKSNIYDERMPVFLKEMIFKNLKDRNFLINGSYLYKLLQRRSA